TNSVTEFVLAKSVDCGVSKAIRGPGKRTETFYASVARAGLEAGLNGDEAYARSLLGGFSITNTGYLDLAMGQYIGWELRKATLDNPTIQRLILAGVLKEESIGPLLAQCLKVLATNAAVPKTFESPLSNHLLLAMREEHVPDITSVVREHAFTNEARWSGAGTVAGHAVSGSLVGLTLGDPVAGFAVGALDSVLDALFMAAATDGRQATVRTVKARNFSQGWEKQPDTALDSVANFYAPARDELVMAGRDLRIILELNIDAIADKLEAGADNVTLALTQLLVATLSEYGARALNTDGEKSALGQAAAGVFRQAAASESGMR
ncbi:MAG: hypothetical protein AAFY60_21010, partial [Myxococcota bacterium]